MIRLADAIPVHHKLDVCTCSTTTDVVVNGIRQPDKKKLLRIPRYYMIMTIVAAGPKDKFPPGSMTKVDVDGLDVLLVNKDGEYYAVDDTCTHAGASLAEGRLDGCNLVCGWHGAEFDCTSGKLVKFPAKIRDLGTYTVSTDDDIIYIEK